MARSKNPKFVFADPPAQAEAAADAEAPALVLVELLTPHPGEWVDATLTWDLGAMAFDHVRGLGLDAVVRRLADGVKHLFVRYPA